jgi:hypothetical protein
MNQDREHLRLLAIFHYVVAGLAALFSFFPLLYTTVGAIFIFAARHPAAAGPKPGEEPPPEFIGWIFAIVGSLLFLLGIAIAICILIAGRSLAKRTRYWFALVVAWHRMSLRSLRNNSRSLYDCRALARVGEGVIFDGASTGLKLHVGLLRSR